MPLPCSRTTVGFVMRETKQNGGMLLRPYRVRKLGSGDIRGTTNHANRNLSSVSRLSRMKKLIDGTK
jgi:hypothetical protein